MALVGARRCENNESGFNPPVCFTADLAVANIAIPFESLFRAERAGLVPGKRCEFLLKALLFRPIPS